MKNCGALEIKDENKSIQSFSKWYTVRLPYKIRPGYKRTGLCRDSGKHNTHKCSFERLKTSPKRHINHLGAMRRK